MEKITLSKKNLILALLLQFVTVAGLAQSQTFTTSGTFIVPPGVTSITVEAWGGGGKGGTRTSNGTGGGGGGGGYARKVITVIPGNSYTVTVGLGSTSTADGGDSWFDSNTTILANGGNSVSNNNSSGANGAPASAYGDYVAAGGNGADGGLYGGGGGSGVGTSGSADNGSSYHGGSSSGGGDGGDGRTSSQGNGVAGGQPGGGGGGARRTFNGTRSGGSGGNGQVVINWAAEIDVQGNSVSIANGDLFPSTTDSTDFGDLNFGSSDTRTFTISNSGSGSLTIGGIFISGADAADFSISSSPATDIAPGGSTTFTVTFNPASTGAKTASISIINNDGNENPFTYSLQGNVIDVEIDVQGNSTSIANNNLVPSVTNGTDFGTTSAVSGAIAQTFTIQNTGTSALSVGTVTVSGPDAADFIVTAQPAASVAGTSATTFIVTFDPLSAGTKTATISFLNSDTDENPYSFSVQGVATDPEMNVTGNAADIASGDLTPSTADWTDFDSTDITTGTVSRTFTIENKSIATVNLTLGAVIISGPDASDFTITTPPASIIPPGGTTICVVTFDPTSAGVKDAIITIGNDDNDHNPYVFAIRGTGTDPEINVQGNAINIVDGDATPAAADWTAFGTTDISSGTIVRNFTIENLGNGNLTIGAITFSGANAADFSVIAAPVAPIAPGASANVMVVFNPSALGNRNATINIASDDLNENPYNFAIQGTGGDPEINLQGNAVSIVNGDTTPSAADWTNFGTTDIASGTITRTFTIQNQNVGTAPLTVNAIFFTGANPSDFSVTTAPATSVAVNGSTTFVITFNPGGTGTRSAVVSIVNNDSNENPYNFTVQGVGADPEMNVVGNGVSIADGDTTPTVADWTNFGTALVAGGTINRTFTIQNTSAGNIALNVGSITFSGADPGEFSVTTLPAATVAVNSSTSFVVRFNPTSNGLKTATLSIANNDSNESPYDFAIQGTGQGPEIDVLGNAISIADGDNTPSLADATDFGGTDLNLGTIVKTFTVKNTGSLTLTLGALTISGTHASNFTLTSGLGSASLAPGASTSFTITFNPSANGVRSAAISIVNNDDNENPYNFSIQGSGESTEINITGNGVSIADGSTSTSTANYTDFGSADINTGSVVRTFIIHNTGTTPLLISGIAMSGLNPGDFTVTSAPNTSISGGASSSFSITFNPSALLSRNATLTVVSNDYNESDYDFAISGYGYIDTDADGVENTADKDDDNDGILDSIECEWTCSLNPFVNGSFESPTIGAATYAILPTSNVTGWQTSAENFIEIWSSGFNGVPAAAGNQFAELNANVPGLLYQTFCLSGTGGSISWSVKHRARQGTDQAFVKFGPNLGSLTTIATMVDGTSAWGTYSGTYTLAPGQTQIILAFQAGYTGSGDGSVGNFIDDIQIIIDQNCRDTDGDTIANSLDLDSDNDGIPDVEEGLFKSYSNNFSKISPLADSDHNGVHDPIDSLVSGGTYGIPDTDGDGVSDYLDLDSDNDAIFDVDESNLLNGDGDINGDGFGDGPDSDSDGILNLYDNNNTFGTAFRPYANDTDGDGLANYREIDANFDGVKDILTTLYGSFDANLDGKIDGSADADKDGILDTFDTKPTAYGSPRDLNRKLFLDFDGRNDYGEAPQMLSGLPQATIMCWIKLNATGNTASIIGQDNFRLWFDGTSNTVIATAKGGVSVSYTTPLTANRWYHICAVYDGSSATQRLRIYVNGRMESFNNSGTLAGALNSSTAKFTIAKNPITSSQYLNASIDEIRIFNSALTTDMIQKMVYQEIKQNGTAIRGEIVPKDIESSVWANLIGYYRMDAYKDDVIDNYTTASVDNGLSTSFARIYNNKVISYQLAPMPFVTTQAGAVDAAVSQNNFVYGNDLYTYDWTILQMKHNINLPYNMSNLGLFVDPSVTLNLNNDNGLTNTWYLKLDGKIDLQGKSQLVQKIFSDLDPTSAGYIERDQQGTTNKWNYNYWASPVGAINSTTNNNNFTVAGVLKDGTNPANPQTITWTSGLNGSPTSPITLSSYWVFKFQNVTNAYANWATCGPNGALLAGQGFTLKGSGAATPTQNYVFTGKPNSGAISSPIAASNLNLSGNPYPSALDANQFITDNLGSLTGSIYLWEHFATNNTHVLVDYQGGYATYTLVGGTPPVAPSGISGLGSSTRTPKRFIPVGQGFFVEANHTGGSIQFNNGQRAFVKENDVTSNIMFRTNANMAEEETDPNNDGDTYEEDTFGRIRVGFNSANNYHRQVLLGFMDENATSGIDPGYDAVHFDDQPNDMYFLNGTTQLNIVGDGYFNEANIYPLGVKIADSGLVSFTLDATQNFDPAQAIYIFDSVTGLYHDIREQMFEIQLPSGTFNNRFSLRFTGGTSLGTGEVTLENGIFVAYAASNNVISIKNDVADTTVEDVALYNMLGQSISTWDVEIQDQHNILIPVKNLAAGTYIVKMKTTNGDISKKIIIK